MAPRSPLLFLAVDGAGSHPAAWRFDGLGGRLLDPELFTGISRRAEAAGFDAVSLDDSFDPPAAERGELPFRSDALLTLAYVAAATSTIGLLATITVTHTEPFHVSKNVATLDLVSGGRAAWRVRVSTSADAAARFGRRQPEAVEALADEAADVIEVVRRLWDSWEDDAVIRDRPTGRYVDRDKLHYVDFHGRWFSVRGPSITPRPPQGQPVVAVDADEPALASLAARQADVVFVTGRDITDVARRRVEVRRQVTDIGRDPEHVAVVAVVTVGEATLRRRLDALGGPPTERSIDLVGSAEEVAADVHGWVEAGAVDGVLLRPDVITATVDWLTAEVLPRWSWAGTAPSGVTFRDRLGLARPANVYAAAVAS